jgi:putative SOS response-associated peptidase YedK
VGDDAAPPREALLGRFGLVPHWSKNDKIARHTYNARSETVAPKPSFRDAWRRRSFRSTGWSCLATCIAERS